MTRGRNGRRIQVGHAERDGGNQGPIVSGIISKEGIFLSIPLALPIPSPERLPQVKLAVR